MKIGYNETCLEHDTGRHHPERAERLRAIRRALADAHGVSYVSPDPTPRDAVERVHDPAYVEDLQSFCAGGGGHWDPDTVACGATFEAALASAGLAVWAARTAAEGAEGRSTPFALGRPPGHHATHNDAMGFCFVNNAAVAAESVLSGDRVDRVAILDWDVHHGNGTQRIFLDRGDVLYASLHQHGIYPDSGAMAETGQGDGAGANLNVPLPPGSGDADYLAAVEDAVGPAIEGFDADLLLVSAGFDAHERDAMSGMRVTSEGYGHLAAAARDVADAADAGLAFVLEGGYDLDSLGESVRTIQRVFAGYQPMPVTDEVSDAARSTIDAVREAHFAASDDADTRDGTDTGDEADAEDPDA
jgi:acetoin utilization deacetylase AcuC-like enzyme